CVGCLVGHLFMFLVGGKTPDQSVHLNLTTTLNHDAGRWLKLGKGQMPVVLEQGENGWLPVAF
ncbi:hypothetical protein M2R54_25715, partial [Klebsiella pneumoniae]|nr:hypothetical protein [Klebsiella pneumoniae]MDZ0087423.1 hypothetical protein [Klebsiella pneumoniae]MDZ0179668.1 hypothetical protein [Klebsiella pneumoniae]